MKRFETFVVLVAVIVTTSSCSYSRSIQRRTNLMSYLYPNASTAPMPAPGNARLQLPLRLGIGFVPARNAALLGAGQEKELLEIVRKAFHGRDWVSEIVMIPSSYLTPNGGFENLRQVANLMGTDVVALVSVDQIQNIDPGRLSFLYLTIVGAYTLPLDRNDTRTLIDLAVFDVPSRAFLLRAPGASHLKGRTTAVETEERLRVNSARGFEVAMTDLAKNLDAEVEDFKSRVVSGERADVEIITQEGESLRGSGSVGWIEVAAGLFIAGFALRRRRWTRISSR